MQWIYDGTFNGFLTAVFEWFERKPGFIRIQTQPLFVGEIFSSPINITSSEIKAKRVWKGITKKLNKEWQRKIYCTWLSEKNTAHNHLFNFLIEVFSSEAPIYDNYGNVHVREIAKMAKSVEREKHRMDAFIRFEKTKDQLYFAKIEPDFNVIPLITKHFKDRYADQQWLIYDIKRKYGIYYDLNKIDMVTMEHAPATLPNCLDENEVLYQELWKNYFIHTNIEARKNTKLHIQHVPRRYHKYLTELQSF